MMTMGLGAGFLGFGFGAASPPAAASFVASLLASLLPSLAVSLGAGFFGFGLGGVPSPAEVEAVDGAPSLAAGNLGFGFAGALSPDEAAVASSLAAGLAATAFFFGFASAAVAAPGAGG